jgi:hypothetical protein
MENTDPETNDFALESFIKLIQVIKGNPEIKVRVEQLLQLNSFRRRSLLNNWLEQLRQQNASEDLLSALSCLFDDKIARKVLTLINNKKWLSFSN